jgi:RHS repeat-associated protein
MYRDAETGFYHTQFRYYNPRLGSWMTPDPAGMGAADTSDPQSLNRYAYAANDPCNSADPYGLAPCSFNVSLQNTNLLSPSELQAAQNEILRIFGTAGLGVNFVSKGADFAAKLVNNPTSLLGSLFGPNSVGFDLFGQNDNPDRPTNAARVWANNIEMATPGFSGVAIGRVTTHEFSHWALNVGNTNLTGPSPLEVGILTPGTDSTFFTSLARFMPNQIAPLQKLCNKLHPPQANPSRSGNGGGGFGDGTWISGGGVFFAFPVYYGGEGGGGFYWETFWMPFPPIRVRALK